jgi:hypothetical protein
MGLYNHLSARLSPDPDDDESTAAASTESTTNTTEAMHATHRPENQEAVDKDRPEQSATS